MQPAAVTATIEAVRIEPFGSNVSDGGSASEPEQHLRALADKLLFKVVKSGETCTLCRTADVSRPVRREGLGRQEAEELFAIWKLRGPQGG